MQENEIKRFKPTDAELDILKVLWTEGELTVREVKEHLPLLPKRGYTTVLKLLQIMTKKGLVKRDTHNRAHIFRAGHTLNDTRKIIIDQLLDKYFNGSLEELIKQALLNQGESKIHIEEINRFLQDIRQ